MTLAGLGGCRRVHPEPLLRRAGAGVPRAPARAGARHPRARSINTGNANAGTGADGLARARRTCAALAGAARLRARAGAAVLHRRDHGDAAGRAHRGRPAGGAGRRCSRTHWADAAEGIMTTDTVPKAASRTVAIGGQHRHRHRHQQGRRHDPARTWRRCSASSPPTRRSRRRCCSSSCARRPTRRSTASRSTATPRPTTRFVLIATQRGRQRARSTRSTSADGQRAARRGDRRSRASWRRRSCATAKARPSSSPCSVDGGATTPSAAASPTRSRTRRWSRRRSSRATRTSAASSRPSAMPASPTSTRAGSTCSSTTCTSSTAAAAAPSYREEDGQRVMKQSEITVRVDLHRGARDGDGVDLRLSARLREDQRRLPLLSARLDARRSRVGAPQRSDSLHLPGARHRAASIMPLTDSAAHDPQSPPIRPRSAFGVARAAGARLIGGMAASDPSARRRAPAPI